MRNQRIGDDVRNRHFKSWFCERRIVAVNRERVERAEIVTANVYDDCKPSRVARFLQCRERKER